MVLMAIIATCWLWKAGNAVDDSRRQGHSESVNNGAQSGEETLSPWEGLLEYAFALYVCGLQYGVCLG